MNNNTIILKQIHLQLLAPVILIVQYWFFTKAFHIKIACW